MATETEAADICLQLGALLESSKDQADDLLAIEYTITKLRAKTGVFLEEQKTDLEAAESVNELTVSYSGNTKAQRSILRGRSLSSAFRKRAYRERKAVNYVLDKMENNLYTSQPETKRELMELCSELAMLFEKSTSVKSAYFESIDGILKSCRVGKKMSPTKPAEQMSKANFETQEDQTKRECIVEDAQPTQADALKLFPFLRNNKISGLHKVLVVGKEGAGKTHLCNEIERSAWGNAQGMSTCPHF